MSKTQSRSRYVSHKECKRMRERFHDKDMSFREFASEYGRSSKCVRRHISHDCRHEELGELYTVEEVVDAVTDFAESQEPARIPTQTEWRQWENKPCSSKRLKTIVESSSWSEVLQACGFPELPRNMSKTIRVALYESPEIMEVRR